MTTTNNYTLMEAYPNVLVLLIVTSSSMVKVFYRFELRSESLRLRLFCLTIASVDGYLLFFYSLLVLLDHLKVRY